jgi:hypothetical protein
MDTVVRTQALHRLDRTCRARERMADKSPDVEARGGKGRIYLEAIWT